MLLLPVSAAVALGTACKGSMSADAKMSAELDGTEEAEARANVHAEGDGELQEHDRPLSPEESARAMNALAPDALPQAEGLPLFGARHDVKVKSTSGAVACRCVGVLLGPPTMTQLEWQGAIPATKPETQLVVALAPEAECPGAPKGSQGASYWGYRVSGNDVIVLLESWQPEGRKVPPPRTIAAIIPKPPAGGQVYVAPVSQRLPFGGPIDGKGSRCAVGNPGPQTSAPLPAGNGADSDQD